MPLYEYKCTKCGHVAEIRHGFNENYEEPCSACGGRMVRVFSAAPVLFKGSGFYVTDSRKGEASSKPSSDHSTDQKSDTKTDQKTGDAKKAPSSESAA